MISKFSHDRPNEVARVDTGNGRDTKTNKKGCKVKLFPFWPRADKLDICKTASKYSARHASCNSGPEQIVLEFAKQYQNCSLIFISSNFKTQRTLNNLCLHRKANNCFCTLTASNTLNLLSEQKKKHVSYIL